MSGGCERIRECFGKYGGGSGEWIDKLVRWLMLKGIARLEK
jgi:hypothetical protein